MASLTLDLLYSGGGGDGTLGAVSLGQGASTDSGSQEFMFIFDVLLFLMKRT